MAWYERFFAGEWLDIQRARYTDEQSAEIADGLCARLALEPGMRVLDVPCGTGAIALPLAERGIEVTGVDLSEEFLADAREGAASRGLTLDLRRADMRDLPWEAEFHAAFNYWGSFGYFDDEGNDAFGRAVHRALRPGGRFLIEGPTLESLYPGWWDRTWSEEEGRKILHAREFDFTTGRDHVTWTFIRDGRETKADLDIRLYSCPELCALLRRVGFTTFEAYANLDGDRFGVGKRLVLVATKETDPRGHS